jgi:hypothetical protein
MSDSLEHRKDAEIDVAGTPHARLLIGALVIIVVAVFSNSLGGQFVYDDVQQIETNQLLGHWDRGTLFRIFTHDIKTTLRQDLTDDRAHSHYYRPIFLMYLMTGYEFAGGRAFRWHCIAIGLHILASVLAFLVVRKTLAHAGAPGPAYYNHLAFLAALFFAVHPVQCESVSWISGSVNPLAAVLSLASIYTYLIYKESHVTGRGGLVGRNAILLAAASVLYGMALLTKESALFVPALIAANELFVFDAAATRTKAPETEASEPAGSRRLLSLVPFVLVAIGYLSIRLILLGHVTSGGGLLGSGGLAQATGSLLKVPALLARYERLVVLPWGLSVNYDFGRAGTMTLAALWFPMGLLIATGLIFFLLWTRSRIARAGILWVIIPLLPHLNPGFFSSEELLHDRYLYLSLIGVGILVSLLANIQTELRPLIKKTCIPALASALAIALCVLTVFQNRVWRDSHTLWSNAVERAPGSRMAHFWLGSLAESNQDLDEAARQYAFAAGADPNCIDCLTNLAFVYAHKGQWDDSIQAFERVVTLTPDHSIAHFNLSFAYAVVRRYKDAIREQRAAIALDPAGPRIDEWRAREKQLEALAQGRDA